MHGVPPRMFFGPEDSQSSRPSPTGQLFTLAISGEGKQKPGVADQPDPQGPSIHGYAQSIDWTPEDGLRGMQGKPRQNLSKRKSLVWGMLVSLPGLMGLPDLLCHSISEGELG